MKLTFHLNNEYMMINLTIIHCCINLRNTLTNIPNCLCLLSTINLRLATLVQWTISPMMLSTTSPTLQRLPAITLILLLKLESMSYFNCIELVIRCYMLLITCILRSSSLLSPLPFSLLITFPIILRLILTLKLLITMLQLPDDFL